MSHPDVDFYQHRPATVPERPMGSIGSVGGPSIEQAARSPCPALRAAAAEQGQLPGIYAPDQRPPYHDPFNGGSIWRPEPPYHQPHNPQTPINIQGWQHPPHQYQQQQRHSRQLPAFHYPYLDPFHMPPMTVNGVPHHFPVPNAPENQNIQTPLPSFNYPPSLPSMTSSTHARDGSQSSDSSIGPGSLPSLNPNSNPNSNQTLPVPTAQVPRAPALADSIFISNTGISHRSDFLTVRPFRRQGEPSTSDSQHRTEQRTRSGSDSEGGNSQPGTNLSL